MKSPGGLGVFLLGVPALAAARVAGAAIPWWVVWSPAWAPPLLVAAVALGVTLYDRTREGPQP